MFTSTLPLDLPKYQIRFDGVVPVTKRYSREMEGYIKDGKIEVDDREQATNNDGIPSWNVRLSIRDRASGAIHSANCRVDAKDKPHQELTSGQYVTFDLLEVRYPSIGRFEPRFAFAGMKATAPGEAVIRSGRPLTRFAVLADGLTIEAVNVREKNVGHADDVREAIKDGKLDADAIATQKTVGTDKTPVWLIDCRIDDGETISDEAITVVAAGKPTLDGLVRVENLTISGWTVGRWPNQMDGTTLSAEFVHAAGQPARHQGRNKPVDLPTPTPEPVPA